MLTAFTAPSGKGAYKACQHFSTRRAYKALASQHFSNAIEALRHLLVLDGLDDALAGCGAGWEETCEDTYKEAREQGGEGW